MIFTAMSVAAENASGTVVDTSKVGATTIVVAVTFTLFLPHQLLRLKSLLCSCKTWAFIFTNRTEVEQNREVRLTVCLVSSIHSGLCISTTFLAHYSHCIVSMLCS